ncbi:MAG: hypothetical protein ABS960_00565 [Solibacillus isronensis]
MDFSQLDKEEVYQKLMRVPLISMQLNHKHLKSSMRDYILPSDDDLEGQFVRDLFILETDEIIGKWYGGKEEAARLLFALKKQ